ncbi:unnamed protein product [Prorocentrum cordatum]|uniref:Uncharacterized protein n=1 Tax=Prorocentrum cordatum TaxID=2364126 RepID=A0ABN9SK28_9DINO|nr:unnamed protein product [Polarella glacialis]
MLNWSSEVARLLVDSGMAQVRLQTCEGHAPLHVAARGGHLEMVRLLASKSCSLDEPSACGGGAPLHTAALGGHAEAARLLLDLGASPLAKAAHGITPLHVAGHKGSLEVASVLVKAGGRAAVAAGDDSGSTPVHAAALTGQAGRTVRKRSPEARGPETSAFTRFRGFRAVLVRLVFRARR